jgi:hypothetical protein
MLTPTLFPPASEHDAPWRYELRVKGHLDDTWAKWFSGLRIMLEDSGTTVLTGPVADQAALHGLLAKVRDLGMPLLLVKCLNAEQDQDCTTIQA